VRDSVPSVNSPASMSLSPGRLGGSCASPKPNASRKLTSGSRGSSTTTTDIPLASFVSCGVGRLIGRGGSGGGAWRLKFSVVALIEIADRIQHPFVFVVAPDPGASPGVGVRVQLRATQACEMSLALEAEHRELVARGRTAVWVRRVVEAMPAKLPRRTRSLKRARCPASHNSSRQEN